MRVSWKVFALIFLVNVVVNVISARVGNNNKPCFDKDLDDLYNLYER